MTSETGAHNFNKHLNDIRHAGAINITYISEEVNLEDIFRQEGKVEYLLCTKIATSQKTNTIIGFALYYSPTSVIAILADGTLVSLGILTTDILPALENLQLSNNTSQNTSALKKMLKVPLDEFVHDILKRNSNQPILKLGSGGDHSQKECYELLQRVSPVLREYFENLNRAREEIEKRVRALKMMKEYQIKELEKMRGEERVLRGNAENLAEKYEDIKDAQDRISKRCEQVLVHVSQKKEEPSDAELEFLNSLGKYHEKVKMYKESIEKLKLKMSYQKLQICNWKAQEEKKAGGLSEKHSKTIKSSLEEMGNRISEMVKEVNDLKDRLNIK